MFYTMKAGDSYIDPVLRGILESSIAENDNDVYTTNIVWIIPLFLLYSFFIQAGIPVMARYGIELVLLLCGTID